MTDDSPYQDAKEFREAIRQGAKKLDDFFRHSTGKVIGPAATKAREGIKSWWGKRQERAKAPLKGSVRAPGEPRAWWPPFGWGEEQSAPTARPDQVPLDQLQPLDPATPDEMTEGTDV